MTGPVSMIVLFLTDILVRALKRGKENAIINSYSVP